MATTALGGALVRDEAGTWRWRDGEVARVRDMRLGDLAPAFRCTSAPDGGCHVEIPKRWRSAGLWPRGHVDADAATTIGHLIRAHGDVARIYAEGLAELRDDHRLTRDGYRIPIEAWDEAMSASCGVWWDGADEPAILDRAKTLGWTP